MGVKYEKPRRGGANCPKCGQWCAVWRTMPPEQTCRVRYHRCDCGRTFKSVEIIVVNISRP